MTQPTPVAQTDFVVDGVGLGARFGFEDARPWFGRTAFEGGGGEAVELEVGTRTVLLAGGEYTCVWLPSGTHTVGLSKGVARSSVDLEAGDIRYFRVLGKLGVESDSKRAFDKAVDKKGLKQVL